MKEPQNTRLLLLLAVCAICIVSAFAIEGGDKNDQLVEPMTRGGRDTKAARIESAEGKSVPLLSLDKLIRSGTPGVRPKADDLFPPSAWVRTPPPAAVVAPP